MRTIFAGIFLLALYGTLPSSAETPQPPKRYAVRSIAEVVDDWHNSKDETVDLAISVTGKVVIVTQYHGTRSGIASIDKTTGTLVIADDEFPLIGFKLQYENSTEVLSGVLYRPIIKDIPISFRRQRK